MAQRPWGKYWSEIEGLPPEEIRRLQNRLLREQVEYLFQRSDFYRKKFSEAGLTPDKIRTIDDLPQVPFTEKSELRDSLAAHPPLGAHVAAPMSEIVQIQTSSGTTGSPTYVALTASDVRAWCEMAARCLYAAGYRPGDVHLHGFGMGKGFVGGVPLCQTLQYMGIINLPVGAEAGAERLLRVARDQRPRLLSASPSFAAYLGEQVPEVLGIQARDLGIERMMVGGEPGGSVPHFRKYLEELWGAKVHDNLGGSDLGATYWGECEHGGGMHYLFPDYGIVELIDPNTGETLTPAEGVKGELVYTALQRQASPIFRFRTRDYVVVTAMECACGRTGYKIQCIGRTDDMLIVRGINVFPSAVQDLIQSFAPETTGMLRIIVDFPGHSTNKPLTIRVEHGENVPPENLPALKTKLENSLRSALSFRANVELVPPGTYKHPGAGKVQLIERV